MKKYKTMSAENARLRGKSGTLLATETNMTGIEELREIPVLLLNEIDMITFASTEQKELSRS